MKDTGFFEGWRFLMKDDIFYKGLKDTDFLWKIQVSMKNKGFYEE